MQSLGLQRSCPLSSYAVMPSHHSNRPTRPRLPKVKFGDLDFAARKLAANGLYSPHNIRRSGIEGLRFSQSSIRLHHRVAAPSLRKILLKEKLPCAALGISIHCEALPYPTCLAISRGKAVPVHVGVRNTAQVVNLCRGNQVDKKLFRNKNKQNLTSPTSKTVSLGSDLGRQQS